MKKLLLVFSISIFVTIGCNTNPTIKLGLDKVLDTSKFTQIQWVDTLANLGKMTMGETKTASFQIKNIGNKPLYITNVAAGCGCTVPDYTKGAIAPGGTGIVTGSFDSNKSHPGEFHKSIFVTTNSANGINQTLVFTGIIVGDKNTKEQPVIPVKPISKN
jgi:hypothetical protein